MKRKLIGTALLLSMTMLAGCAPKTVSTSDIAVDAVVEPEVSTEDVEEQQSEVVEEPEAVTEQESTVAEEASSEETIVASSDTKKKSNADAFIDKKQDIVQIAEEEPALASVVQEPVSDSTIVNEVDEVKTQVTTTGQNTTKKKHSSKSSSNSNSSSQQTTNSVVDEVKGEYTLVWRLC